MFLAISVVPKMNVRVGTKSEEAVHDVFPPFPTPKKPEKKKTGSTYGEGDDCLVGCRYHGVL